ncbi:hypothetical protein BJ508DRAFT_332721 [Ascobolus immersus RN42]|uniref:Uncharacterized protein n=1 Tax=Ascobolus immersus RN42 TaxID=1160509 RepID=A0A3N4HLZ0_ASCIM|nr:hypothetical protein BJ508DRAFT_332721 [Ascobolus immersus RN42]
MTPSITIPNHRPRTVMVSRGHDPGDNPFLCTTTLDNLSIIKGVNEGEDTVKQEPMEPEQYLVGPSRIRTTPAKKGSSAFAHGRTTGIFCGFDPIYSHGPRKRPRKNFTETYYVRPLRASHGEMGLMMFSYRSDARGGWLNENREWKKIMTLFDRHGVDNITIQAHCFWYRRFDWNDRTCWNGNIVWKGFFRTSMKCGYDTDDSTADEFSDAESDWSDLE